MAIKIKIKKQSQGCSESVEPIEEIFGNPWSKKQATTQTMAQRGMKKADREEISDMLSAHDPGSSEHNNKKNPYNIPEGEPPIDATFLVDLYTRLSVKGDKLRIQSADRTMGTLGLYMKRAAAAESEQDVFSAVNRAKLYLDDLYRRVIAMGVDPQTGEKKDEDDDGPGDDIVIECDEERGYEWDASKGKCVKKETGEVEDPKCPEEGQTWDSEAGKCVDGGEETPPPEGESKAPVPIYKFPKEKGEDGKRLQPLSSKLAKAGLNKATINTILRSIAKQLKSNNVEITEGLLREAASMVLERLNLTVLNEKVSPDTSKFAGMTDVDSTQSDDEKKKLSPQYWNKNRKAEQKVRKAYTMDWLKKLRKVLNIDFETTAVRAAIDRAMEKAAGPTVQLAEAKSDTPSIIRWEDLHKELMKVPRADDRKKKISGSEAEKLANSIMKWLKTDSKVVNSANIDFEMPGDAGEDEDTTEEPEKKGPPKAWVTEGGTQEEWDALPNKEKFVFLKMESDKRRKFFKMSSEERLDLYKKMKTGGPTKASTGAEETAGAQAAAGEKAAEKGFGKEAYEQGDGKIRISTLNQQLKTIDPQADQGERKKSLNLVQKHLKPYLKINNLKLSESEIRNFANQIVEVILKRSKS
tara:strand:+ start:594 stop:2507 length:1914 start_codon:yes stop_codon:yes gene_type:complete